MASSAKNIFFFLLITVSSSSLLHITHARDSQFFSKTLTTTTNTNTVVPKTAESKENTETKNNNQDQAEPSFLPQNEESYGLYGHETGQLPPSSTATDHEESKQPLHKYLPKNYNPVAYVTVPENTNKEETNEFREEASLDRNPDDARNFNNGQENYYNGQLTKEEDFSEDLNKNSFYRLGSDFNSPRETTPRAFERNGDEGFEQRQGMSDTRFLENGKYHYDVNSGNKFISGNNHPYETLNEDEFKGEENDYKSAGEYNNQQDDKFRYGEDNNMP